jgi:putative GTP pyrophosphokinase
MNEIQVAQIRDMIQQATRFLMTYHFALKEMETKIDILQEEFQMLHDYNPIEHVKTRVKSVESLVNKIRRKGIRARSFDEIRKEIKDIAGVRITCSFLSDIYKVSEMLSRQDDLTVLEVKDYIKNPKPNGYRSLHMIVEVPVFMSDRCERVNVEVQIRTIAQDFWASLEHKIFYKYDGEVPALMLRDLKEAAETAAMLDEKMEFLHNEIIEIKKDNPPDFGQDIAQLITGRTGSLPAALLELAQKNEGRKD